MPEVSENTENPSFLALGFAGGIILIFVTTTALVFGAVCRYLMNLCKRLCAKRKKRPSTIRKSSKKLPFESGVAMKREDSLRMVPPGCAVVKHHFSIPKTKSEVLPQPALPQTMDNNLEDCSDEREVR